MPRIVIIGAGHNGLVCACYLAKAGHEVTVVEKHARPGGCTVTEELLPGFKINTGALELEGIINSEIDSDLELAKHGLKWIRKDHMLSAMVGTESIHLMRDPQKAAATIAKKRGEPSAEEWSKYSKFSSALMDVMGTFQHVKTPEATAMQNVLSASGDEKTDIMIQTTLQPASVVINHWIQDETLRGAALAYSTHPQMPPWIPGTGVLGCLLGSSHEGQGARPKGGTGALIDSLVSALEAAGGTLQCGSGVAKVEFENSKLQAVELENGEKLSADILVSTIDISRLSGLLPESLKSDSFKRAARNAHSGLYNVGEIKVDLALSEPPTLSRDAPEFTGALHYLMDGPDHYNEHFRKIGAGLLPKRYPMMAAVPSADDPSMAPEGQATLWLSAFVPAKIDGSENWPEANEAVAEAVIDSFATFSPGVKDTILAKRITGPSDWEKRTGNPAGNPNQLDMTIDQLFGFRPGIGQSRYATDIPGIYLSGAGTHPGGGVHGMPGKLAAKRILDDLAGRRDRSKPSLWSLFKSARALRKSM
ncbi:MAG: NAD(P)/FAD-dependent oxidoreductase [Verrucomicrobiota bacterium]